ncbi:MAG TPA: hypothetical protein VEU47_08670, partial [Candidatus Cybelea sp.]|nr:hypothetical protein [Candidatus Cybelea sp.]
VRRDRVLVQHAGGVLLFLGLGPRAARLRRFAFGEDLAADPFIARCRRVDAAIENGKRTQAEQFGISPAIVAIRDQAFRRRAIAEALARAGYNPDEPRVPAGDPDRGRWTTEASAAEQQAGAHVGPAAAHNDPAIEAKKQRFVDAHRADAEKVAKQLGVPVENILALSALESG